ncbi:CapA family protein [Actinorugispora endophytica]|uniref:Poly-gamma-glutamate synthesis protein (Capsule biosynthesis protein) n=1 Tax=Actinorugispora endophytica TaxID=1605990 RepID=A0A4R6V4R7_9ACTN|nr:CapA family protein [Actinorugispora endophytica]TDQ55331.1 poly-gamma-glutamate synthesis protein (capsule biosynthesis protein) [Actinorugispora endophytica]
MIPRTPPFVPYGPPLRLGALLLATALAATACDTDVGAPVAADQPRDGAPAESAAPAPSESAGEPYTVAIGGDVMFEGMLRQRLDADPATAVGPVSTVFREADVSVVNLETAVTGGGTRAPGKQFAFRAPATAFTALDSAGIDVATLANNHGMDFGADGLADTLANAEAAGFPLVGAGDDADEAYAPEVFEVNGNTLAVIGATDVMDEHLTAEWTAGDGKPGLASTKGEALPRALQAVEEARAEADAVIVFLHWGREGDHCPLPHAPDLARQLIDAGATAVVGGHAHVVGPGGYMGGSYVHYGLGNFVFYNFDGPTAETGVLRLTLQGDEVLDSEWLPGEIQGGVPVLHEGDAAEQGVASFEGYRDRCGGAGLTAEPDGSSA